MSWSPRPADRAGFVVSHPLPRRTNHPAVRSFTRSCSPGGAQTSKRRAWKVRSPMGGRRAGRPWG